MPQALKWFLCILIGCCWVNIAHAADSSAPAAQPNPSSAAAAKAAPAIQVPETSYDFGAVQQGKVIEHNFMIKNTGKGTLQIKQVRPG